MRVCVVMLLLKTTKAALIRNWHPLEFPAERTGQEHAWTALSGLQMVRAVCETSQQFLSSVCSGLCPLENEALC